MCVCAYVYIYIYIFVYIYIYINMCVCMYIYIYNYIYIYMYICKPESNPQILDPEDPHLLSPNILILNSKTKLKHMLIDPRNGDVDVSDFPFSAAKALSEFSALNLL